MNGSHESSPIKGGFSQKDIIKIKNKTKCGDKIKCHTLKACTTDSAAGSRTEAVRTGEVIGKFPHHVRLRFANGLTESLLWVDLIKKKESTK